MIADHLQAAADHREAMRLERNGRRVPVITLLLGSLLGTSILSAVSMLRAW